jgi:hypothetical protein
MRPYEGLGMATCSGDGRGREEKGIDGVSLALVNPELEDRHDCGFFLFFIEALNRYISHSSFVHI